MDLVQIPHGVDEQQFTMYYKPNPDPLFDYNNEKREISSKIILFMVYLPSVATYEEHVFPKDESQSSFLLPKMAGDNFVVVSNVKQGADNEEDGHQWVFTINI